MKERPKSREETPKVGSDGASKLACIAALHMGLFGGLRNVAAIARAPLRGYVAAWQRAWPVQCVAAVRYCLRD